MAEYEYENTGNSEAQQKVALSRLFAQTGGNLAATGVLGGLVVTQAATANGTVLIAVGSAVVQPSMTVGASLLVCDSQKTLDIFTANPMGGLARNDIVVFDSLTASIIAITGVPNATPTDPTVPNTAIALARLRHAASATTIPTAKIDSLIVATTLRGIIPAQPQIGFGVMSGTTSAGGFLYINHGLAWTPSSVQLTPTTVNHASIASVTSTQIVCACTRWDTGGTLVSSAMGVHWAAFA